MCIRDSKKGLAAKGYRFFMDSPTNQIFVVLENAQLAALEGKAKFGFWEKFDDSHTCLLYTSPRRSFFRAAQLSTTG